MKLLEMNSLGEKYLITLGLCDSVSTGIRLSLIPLFVYIQSKVGGERSQSKRMQREKQ